MRREPLPTYRARVISSGPSILLMSLGPNWFRGKASEIDQLVRDFSCLDGAPYEWYSASAATSMGIRGERMALPYTVRSANTRSAEMDEVLEAADDLKRKLASVVDCEPIARCASEQIELLEAMWASIEDHPFASLWFLPDGVASEPAFTLFARVVDLRLEPEPAQELVEFRRAWFFSYA